MAPAPLYLLSGLCADERLFQFLRLHYPAPKVLRWVTPSPEDTMVTYAARLITQMEPSPEPPILLGLSFGGMMVQEIAKQIPVRRVILLSSLANTDQLPWHYRLAGALRLQHWFPLGLFKHWVGPAYWVFGAKTPEEKRILKAIIQNTQMRLLRWSLNQILYWRHHAQASDKLVLLHGDQDKILPVPAYPHVHMVKGGEHLMVMGRAAEISAVLNQYLS